MTEGEKRGEKGERGGGGGGCITPRGTHGDAPEAPRWFSGSQVLDHSSRPHWLMKLASLRYCQLSVPTGSGLRKREGLPPESATGAVLVNSADGRQQLPVGLVGLETAAAPSGPAWVGDGGIAQWAWLGWRQQWRPVGLVGLEGPGGHDRLPR